MEVLITSFGILLLLAGLVGCIIPLLPGPPLGYLGLLLQQLHDEPPFTARFLVVWAIITLIVTIVDYFVPVYGTRRFGGSRYGIWGSLIGLFAGLWFGPIGVILGPLIGAFLGELLVKADVEPAMRAAFGSFVGFVAGTGLKLITCLTMTYYFVKMVLL